MIRSIRADNPGPFTLDGTRSWIIDESIIVDPGPDDDAHIDALIESVPRLQAILVTHRHADHAGAVEALMARTDAPVFAPEGVHPHARTVRDGDSLELENANRIRVIGAPGHTGEHVCYMTERGELFTGDTILGEGTTTIFPPDGNMTDYLATLRKLLALEPRTIYPGHGPERHDAIELINHYIEHRERRSNEILTALEKGPANGRSLREAIYAELDPRLHGAAETQIQAHLDDLEGRRLVEADEARDTWALKR